MRSRLSFLVAVALMLWAAAPAALAMAPEEINQAAKDGITAFNSGDRESGLQSLRQALDGAEEYWGKDDPNTDNVAYALARMYTAIGASSSATNLYERLYENLDQRAPDDDRLPLIRYQLAVSMMGMEPEEAIDAFNGTIRLMRKHGYDTPENANPLIVRAHFFRGYSQLNMHKSQDARRSYSKATDLAEKLFGDDSQIYAEALYARAQYYVAVGNDRKAAEEFEDVLARFSEMLPDDSLSILNVHASLVPIYERLDNSIKATDHLMVVAEKMPDEDDDPKPIYRVQPSYPSNMAMSGKDGVILLKFRITPNGYVDDIVVEQGDPDSAFAEASIEALKQWRYKPRFENGKPVSSYARFQMTFEGLDYTPLGSRIAR